MSRRLRGWWFALFALLAMSASAHEISMAEMELRQATPTEFLWRWTAGMTSGERTLQPTWPGGCHEESGVVRCADGGLSGRFGIEGVGKRFSAVLVKVYWLDGAMRVYTITSGQPSVMLYGAADDHRGMGEVASAYAVLGVEHILSGYDHLLFVSGLLFLVGFGRRLLWTITAFTLAHSVTLVLGALGWLVLSPPPVEAMIALSIMLVAGEALHDRPTLSRRWPALVAFLFGLVHGLGFAGALKQFGLPENHLAVALLTFNLGVEAGQLMVVLFVWLAVRALRRWPVVERSRTALLYAMGAIAAYWSIGRIVAMLA